MASERQVEANRRNSARSTGPKTEPGKARSRANATTHGLAAKLLGPEGVVSGDDPGSLGASPEFVERRARWAGDRRPVGEAANWALDRAVVASFRIERCERAFNRVVADSRWRAAHAWAEDRAGEAAKVASGLARDPVLASRRLQTSLAGVDLLIEAWLGLIAALEAGRDWSEAERSRALDLLGSMPDLRSGRTLVDPLAGESPIACRIELAFEELGRLEALRDEALAPLDELDRRGALQGDLALLSRPARLVLRYERDAWRQYREAMGHLGDPRSAPLPPSAVPSPPEVAPDPTPIATTPPTSAGPPAIAEPPALGDRAAGRTTEAPERSQSGEAPRPSPAAHRSGRPRFEGTACPGRIRSGPARTVRMPERGEMPVIQGSAPNAKRGSSRDQQDAIHAAGHRELRGDCRDLT